MIKVGTTLKDGTIYAGEHPKEDGYLVCNVASNPVDALCYDDAIEQANLLNMRLPSIEELTVLYAYRKKIGGFVWKWYWSSTSMPYLGLNISKIIHHFIENRKKTKIRTDVSWRNKNNVFYVRFVRTVTQEELEALT